LTAEVTQKDTLIACALKVSCYNADNLRNTLFRKGLPVIQFGLVRNVGRICLIAAALSIAVPAPSASAGQTTARGTTSTVKKKTTYSAKAARQRRAQLAQARATAQAKALKEAQTPRYKFDDTGAIVPDIRAEAAIIYNPQNGQVLWESNSQDQRSIASITKVMTAVVVLEQSSDLAEAVVVDRGDVRAASTTYLRAGDRVTKEDLLHLLLIASDNAAARVLARTSSHGATGFITRMNEKAAELGLTSTKYADPSGLLAANVSSAYDMARLITYVSANEHIASIMRKQSHSATASRRKITIHSTNQLVRQGDVDVQAGKTGFISKAGYCLATLLQLPQGGPQVAVVVLGAKSNAGRFWETRHLFNWMTSKASELVSGKPVEAATTASK
jgi:D-alanyl-D-alanine endopeptidase (penicillin-binding protein 7)